MEKKPNKGKKKPMMFRINNVNLKDLIDSLQDVYSQSLYTDIVINMDDASIIIEPPDWVTLKGDNTLLPTGELLPINSIIMNDSLYKLLTKKMLSK